MAKRAPWIQAHHRVGFQSIRLWKIGDKEETETDTHRALVAHDCGQDLELDPDQTREAFGVQTHTHTTLVAQLLSSVILGTTHQSCHLPGEPISGTSTLSGSIG